MKSRVSFYIAVLAIDHLRETLGYIWDLPNKNEYVWQRFTMRAKMRMRGAL